MARRPPFEIALEEWKRRLAAAGHSTNVRWALHENLCVHHRRNPFHLFYQLNWPPLGHQQMADVYNRIAPAAEVVAFQYLFSEPAFTLCTLAGDPWESEDEDLHDEWNLYFTVGEPYQSYSEVQGWWEWRLRRLLATGKVSGIDFVVSHRLALRLASRGARAG